MKNVVLLSGPACVGKGPMVAAIRAYRPDIRFGEVPVIKSLECRPKGLRPTDDPAYFFPAETINSWRETVSDHVVGDVYKFPQAIRLEDIKTAAGEHDIILTEAYYSLAGQFRTSPLMNALGSDINLTTVFMSPMTIEEFAAAEAAGHEALDAIRQSRIDAQVARALFLGTQADENDFRKRADSAIGELASMANYHELIICRDPEGHPNWNQIVQDGKVMFDPNGQLKGDALTAFEKICAILTSGTASVTAPSILGTDAGRYGIWAINEFDEKGKMINTTEITGYRREADAMLEDIKERQQRVNEDEHDYPVITYDISLIREAVEEEGAITVTDDGYHPEDYERPAAPKTDKTQPDDDKDWVGKLHHREGDDVTDFDYGHGNWRE